MTADLVMRRRPAADAPPEGTIENSGLSTSNEEEEVSAHSAKVLIVAQVTCAPQPSATHTTNHLFLITGIRCLLPPLHHSSSSLFMPYSVP
uniref:Uncharacterized protein n=1 Tax=Knipowitschia caucasica TaxID=637954 RepID=A0AAV2M037_KNICA